MFDPQARFEHSPTFAGLELPKSLPPTLSTCFPPTHLLQTRINKFGNPNFVILPHECLHRLWALKEMGPLYPETLQLCTLKYKMLLIPNGAPLSQASLPCQAGWLPSMRKLHRRVVAMKLITRAPDRARLFRHSASR